MKLKFAHWERQGSVISLARSFLSWHIPLWRRDMFINHWKAKTGTRFLRVSLSFKWINRVCRFDSFPWNLVRTFTDRCGTKQCRQIRLREFFDSPTWQIYRKITNRNKRKCWHSFGDWGFVIDTAQLFCMNECIWYPINSLEHQSVILELTASAAFGKQNPKQNIILSNSTFYNLSVDILT